MEDLLKQSLEQLILFVQSVATEVWAMAVRQVYAIAIRDIIFSVLFLLIGVVGTKVSFKQIKSLCEDDSDYSYLYSIPVVIDAIFTVVIFCNIENIVLSFVNPNYQAIKLLLSLVK
jgi:hypothetical protein